MMALAVALAIAAAPPSTPLDEDERWILLRAREWMARVGLAGGSGWDGDVAAGIRDAAPLSPTDPLIAELEPLLRTVASRAPRGIAPSEDRDQLPWRTWTLAWLDVDGDERLEIVLAGGTSPAPFFAVLQRTAAAGPPPWRLLHLAPFRFLGAGTRSGRLFLFSAFDGYGVAGPALAVDRIDAHGPGPSTSVRLLFDLPGWDSRRPSSGAAVAPCATTRRTQLRTEPRRDDAPRDLGLGWDFPGNLFQTIEKGATGWRIDSTQGPDGRSWALCLFAGPTPMAAEHPEKEMSRPLKATRKPLAAGGRVLVGWLPGADLEQR